MYIVPDKDVFRTTFEEIRQSSLSHSTCKVVLFVSATDIDALCSARMLSTLFKSELIPHKTVPVVGYSELKEMFMGLDDDIVNVLCVGCGATVDLESHFEIVDDGSNENANKRKIYVIDNHRPWNLDNLFGSDQVVCLDDGSVRDNLEREREAYQQMQLEEEEEEEGASDGSDIDSDSDTDGDGDGDIGGNDNDNDLDLSGDTLNEGSNDKENRNPDSKRDRQARKRAKRENYSVLEAYYNRGTFLTGTNATQTYALLSDVGSTSVVALWLTVIGVTAVGNQNPQIYSDIIALLKSEVTRLCPQSSMSQLTNSFSSDDSSLYVETDYAFFLLRHWSLYDAMVHSSYLSAKLELWTEDGRKRLHKMLAKMGISLQESREQWMHMRIDVKRTLKDKLASITGPFGIEQVIREGIIRKYGFKGSVSAGDAVEAVEALLQGPVEFATAIQNEEDVQDGQEKEKFWINNFWDGWDALANVNKLMGGIDRAKSIQKIITATGTALFEKKQIKDLRAYRLAVVRDGPDIGLFRNPLALQRLGIWVAEGCAETLTKQLPLVIASLDTVSNTYLVLGMAPFKVNSEELDGDVFNQFGHAFQTTATRINARVKLDAFESSIIEVAKDDLSRFLEALTLSGLVT